MKHKNKNFYVQIILHLIAILLVIIILLPAYIMVTSSLKPYNKIFDFRLIPRWSDLTLENYIQALQLDNFFTYMYNSFFVAATVTIVALFLHSMAGYSFSMLNFPGKKIIFVWTISTMMVPFAVIMIPLFIIVRSLGLMNSLWGVIIPMIPHAYGIFLYRQFFLGIPIDLKESAKIDGSSHFGTYMRVIMPLSKPITLTLAVNFFIANWNNFLWPLIIIYKRELWMIQLFIANLRGERQEAWNIILAASCLSVMPTVILFCIFQRYLVDGIKMTGLKS